MLGTANKELRCVLDGQLAGVELALVQLQSARIRVAVQQSAVQKLHNGLVLR